MKITSTEQVFNSCKWVNLNCLVFDLYSSVFKKSVPVEIDFDPNQPTKEIRDKTLASIIEFQTLSTAELDEIYNAMWQFVLRWRSEEDRHRMGISQKSEAINKTTFSGVGFINDEKLDHTFFYIFLSVDWDTEHGVTISYYNGKLDDVE